MAGFVPDGFVPPRGLATGRFRLAPLEARHNQSDYAAWTSSVDHIRGTPGFAGRNWPTPMTLEENRADLARHARDFAERSGFTYTVLDDDDAVIGCVYIYPSEDPVYEAEVRSWVRASDAALDASLWRAVSGWLAAEWPFRAVHYAQRDR